MDKTTGILSAIMTLGLVLVIAPNIIAMNRGKVLRNIALWLLVFAGLGLAYKTFGPGSDHQLFMAPNFAMHTDQDPDATPVPTDKDDGSKGFTPPKEE